MIADWLVQDWRDLLAQDGRARVILWCDAGAEFRNVLPDLFNALDTAGYVLVAYDAAQNHGALWCKWAVEAGPGAEKNVVLWLPYALESLAGLAADGARLDCLLEYRYSALAWEIGGQPATLFGFLKQHGVPLPTVRSEQDALCRGGADSLLAKYVRHNQSRDSAFWRSIPLTAAYIESVIVGNLDDRLLRLLADPGREWRALQDLGIGAEFCSQVRANYVDATGLASDPAAWAEDYVTGLIALEVFESSGRPDDYPFALKVPAGAHRGELLAFLKRWMKDHDYRDAYRDWALRIEPAMDMRSWASDKAGRPQALRGCARERWDRFLHGLIDLGTNDDAIGGYLAEKRAAAEEEAKGFWANAYDDLPGWRMAVDLADLVARAQQAAQQAVAIHSAPDLVDAYVAKWHMIDLDHWRLLDSARKADGLEPLAAIADRFYTRYADATARAFYKVLREQSSWPPEGCRGVAEVAGGLYRSSKSRRAILMVDALRFDLAVALRQRLDDGDLEGVVANVPSETWVGMTSLLPAVSAQLSVKERKPHLRTKSGGDMCLRSDRWKILETAGAKPLPSGKGGPRRDEIAHLWELTETPKELPNLLVLFDRGVDAIGHGTGYEVLQHFEQLLAELERAIRRLRSWGYTEIHVVTDHGFLLLHNSASIQRMEIDKANLAVTSGRWGLVPSAEGGIASPDPGVATVPFALDTRWRVALAPGLRSFAEPGSFTHGGATLQEVVIPHLCLRTTVISPKMRVLAMLPMVEIATLSVKVILQPEIPAQPSLMGSPEPVRVKVFLGTVGAPRSTIKDIEVGSDSGSISLTLFLNDEPPIMRGAEIPLQVLDADTDEAYASGLFVRAARDLG